MGRGSQIKYGPETSYEERAHDRMQIVYAGKMRERQIFMQELKQFRKLRDMQYLLNTTRAIGPTWYHTLSVPQREALDGLELAIYQDILEGRPVRTAKIIAKLGLYPRPRPADLMDCIDAGKDDPKAMLARLFVSTQGHSIEGKRQSYCLNAKLILSAILYLGLDHLITLLRERFRPDKQEKPVAKKQKPKPIPPLASPYLQKLVAVLYDPPRWTRKPPPPLPNLDGLNNEPYEEELTIPKPPPPPPPPPPPKKRLPQSLCDKMAGVVRIEPHSSVTAVMIKTVTKRVTYRGKSKVGTEVKKTYGLGLTNVKKGGRRKKPVPPSTGMWNSQYMINGIFKVGGKTVYVLGNVTILPPEGDLIHGGYRRLNNEFINIHCGFCGRSPPPKPDPCDCVKKWQNTVFQYVKSTKCYCEHYYDYGNEGTFAPDELPFFIKPTKNKPFEFNYDTIYDLDPKHLHVAKEFKRIWDTESMLHIDDGTVKDKKDKKKKKKRSSKTCLGQNPKPEDYLKCALRLMRRVNIAARLPDVHLVPELKEWMRMRMYGPYSEEQKKEMKRKSTMYWQFFHLLASKGYGHISPMKDATYSGLTTWSHKQKLNDKFTKFREDYRMSLFRSLAKINNILWTTMYQAQFPDKKFREIYFSYLFGRVEDLLLVNPYSTRDATERKLTMQKRRYVCIPEGMETLQE